MKEEKIILNTDPESAEYKTDIKGWVSRNGYYFGEMEVSARNDGATHWKCAKCESVFLKDSYCRSCAEEKQEEKQTEKYNAMPEKEWDGEQMIYSNSCDKYFNTMEDVLEWLEMEYHDIRDLQLILCDPVYPREITDEYWEDELPEDFSLAECDPILGDLISKVNTYIRAGKPILSWTHGKFKLKIEEE